MYNMQKKVVQKSGKKVAKKAVAKKSVQSAPKQDKIVGYKTVALNYASWHDPKYVYKVGGTFTVPNPVKDGAACGPGLHFAPTEKGAKTYASDGSYRMLLVEADKTDLLGKDNDKFRVSKLTVVKELEKKEFPTQEWKDACKDIKKSLDKWYLVPTKSLTTQKISGLAHSYLKSIKSNAKLHVVTNPYEAAYIATRSTDSICYHDVDDESNEFVEDLNLKSNDLTSSYDTGVGIETHVKSALMSYLSTKNDSALPSQDSLFELIKLGCAPLERTSKDFYLFVPQEPVLKMKLPV